MAGPLKKCKVQYKKNGEYYILCTSERFGRHEYRYAPGDDRIWRNEKKYLLLESAGSAALQQAADTFEAEAEQIRRDGSFSLITHGIGDCGFLKIWFRYQGTVFDALCIFESTAGVNGAAGVEHGSLHDIGRAVEQILGNKFIYEEHHCFLPFNQRELEQNPIYQAIVQKGERDIQISLEMTYGTVSDDSLDRLTDKDGLLRLHRLPAEYDRMFAVAAETVNFALLTRSGYRFCHRSNFAMAASTRKAVTLNPHTKYAVDAAYVKLSCITFGDYLQMFGPVDMAGSR